jgi:hypothetical protein
MGQIIATFKPQMQAMSRVSIVPEQIKHMFSGVML